MTEFIDALRQNADQALPNVSVTENGALGFKTAGSKLVDLNFSLSSMRNMDENEIWTRFLEAYNENPTLSLLWLFFARDIREGCGERRTFRVIFGRFCNENPPTAIRLIKLIPFYGRWDDVVEVFCSDVPCKVRDEAFSVIMKQLSDDLDNARAGKPISLLVKWLPSLTTSSAETRRRAELLRNSFGYTPKQYRKVLTHLRYYLGVVEQKMSFGDWGKIDYEKVPSRAAMNYREAFARHDADRYTKYLSNVKSGEAKIHAGAVFPYDIVHAYEMKEKYSEPLELQWAALPNKVPDQYSTLVVVDGSGSMGSTVGPTGVTCHDVARSLAIYFSEKLKGPFKDTFITFSANPRVVKFQKDLSLRAKLNLLERFDECSNTNIEKTFDLILDTAVKNHMTQDMIPANILIVSDMEFDAATCSAWYRNDSKNPDQALFDQIADRWECAGYKLPRLVFWNVCSRTGTIPLTENDLGVALVSGFSPNIADMVMSGDLDPYNCLVARLTGGRYAKVEEALKG